VADTLPPYWRNVRKRLTKTPKLHFVDTGLAAHLLDLHGWPQAVKLNLAGALTESWVHHHLRVFAALAPRPPALNFFRTTAGGECDFVVASDRLLPIEVKMTETPSPRDVAGVRTFLELFAKQAPFGLLLYPGTQVLPLADRILALPMAAFLGGTRA
jgi:predicted AAA+ superfamily ATPase